MSRKTLKSWIAAHRKELDEAIQRACPGAKRNDDERRLWVLNDEGLYKWAKSEGVNL